MKLVGMVKLVCLFLMSCREMSAQTKPEIMDGKNTEVLRSEVMILGHCTDGGSLGSRARAPFSAVLMEENTNMSLLLIYNILIEP